MNGIQKIKTGVLPFIKGAPFIFLTLCLTLFLARTYVNQAVPVYQSVAKVKLDDLAYGFSNNNLYSDFDVFASENKIEAEVQVLRSPLLIKKAIQESDLNCKTFQIIDNDEKLVFGSSNPIVPKIIGKSLVVGPEYLGIIADSSGIQIKGRNGYESYHFGDTLEINGHLVWLETNTMFINRSNGPIKCVLRLQNIDQEVDVITNKLHITSVDKEIPVIRLVFDDFNHERAKQLVDNLCQVYIKDYVDTKSAAAVNTMKFIDDRLEDVKKKLDESESRLEEYKIENDVVNTLQETETGLREIANLKIQLINTEMQQKSIDSLESYISSGVFFSETAVNFGFGDLVLTELVKKLQILSDEKRDLSLKYTPNDPKMMSMDLKINEIKNYIVTSIQLARSDVETRRLELSKAIEVEQNMFEGIPSREKEMKILQREFLLNEKVYTFLSQKRTEAAIASSALISFHRIIQPATSSLQPISPNRTLIYFISGVFGLLLGIATVFIRRMMLGRIVHRCDIEEKCSMPVIGVVRKIFKYNSIRSEVGTLASSILAKTVNNHHRVISVCSSVRQEGRSYIAVNLAKEFASLGYKTLYADFDAGNSINEYSHIESNALCMQDVDVERLQEYQVFLKTDDLHLIRISRVNQNISRITGAKNFSNVFEDFSKDYDVVIVDTSPIAVGSSAIPLMKLSVLNLFVMRAKFTKKHFALNPDFIQNEYGVKNLQVVLNGAHKASNYNGMFVGSGLNYESSTRGFLARILVYIRYYVR